MRSRQTGITLIGWLVLLAPMAICGYAAVRLTPVFLNYMNVARALEGIKSDNKGVDSSSLNVTQLRNSVDKRLDVENVTYPTAKDIKITRVGKGWQLEADYDDQAPLFSNVFILVSFDKSVTVGGGATE